MVELDKVKRAELVISRKTSDHFKHREFSVWINGDHLESIKDGETKRLEVPLENIELQVTCGLKNSNKLFLNSDTSLSISIQIIDKPASNLTSWVALFFWAFCLASGALISPSLGSAIGFCIGYFIRIQLINNYQVVVKNVK